MSKKPFPDQNLQLTQFLSAQLRHLDGFDASISQIFFSVESHLGLMTNYCHKLPKKSSRVQKTIPTLKEVFSSSEDNSSIGFSNGIKKSFHFQSYEKNRQPHCLQRTASKSSQEDSPIAKSFSWLLSTAANIKAWNLVDAKVNNVAKF